MKTLIVFLILGVIFFFARNVPLTVGDVVIFLLFLWFNRWCAKKEQQEKKEREEKERQAAEDASYEPHKPLTVQDVAELNASRIARGQKPLSDYEIDRMNAGARWDFPG